MQQRNDRTPTGLTMSEAMCRVAWAEGVLETLTKDVGTLTGPQRAVIDLAINELHRAWDGGQ
jgi:hypothetical protein